MTLLDTKKTVLAANKLMKAYLNNSVDPGVITDRFKERMKIQRSLNRLDKEISAGMRGLMRDEDLADELREVVYDFMVENYKTKFFDFLIEEEEGESGWPVATWCMGMIFQLWLTIPGESPSGQTGVERLETGIRSILRRSSQAELDTFGVLFLGVLENLPHARGWFDILEYLVSLGVSCSEKLVDLYGNQFVRLRAHIAWYLIDFVKFAREYGAKFYGRLLPNLELFDFYDECLFAALAEEVCRYGARSHLELLLGVLDSKWINIARSENPVRSMIHILKSGKNLEAAVENLFIRKLGGNMRRFLTDNSSGMQIFFAGLPLYSREFVDWIAKELVNMDVNNDTNVSSSMAVKLHNTLDAALKSAGLVGERFLTDFVLRVARLAAENDEDISNFWHLMLMCSAMLIDFRDEDEELKDTVLGRFQFILQHRFAELAQYNEQRKGDAFDFFYTLNLVHVNVLHIEAVTTESGLCGLMKAMTAERLITRFVALADDSSVEVIAIEKVFNDERDAFTNLGLLEAGSVVRTYLEKWKGKGEFIPLRLHFLEWASDKGLPLRNKDFFFQQTVVELALLKRRCFR